ncbi:CHAT domain-containing protein [Rhizobium redzepovicii]|uniref:CHAT domain-containing protein n=1 Tax=Rhizobium redzepovicii TaxID=2867518 RepID=UPI0028714E8A|nr:CHAT domain-containing protein [Rhizobium redzepovicii]MDR9781131.1 CHAT domain-containing protein [Rhizobium redzepovicii]
MKARILVACAGIALVLTPAFTQTEQERAADLSNVEEYRTDAGPWPSTQRTRADLVAVILQQRQLAEAEGINSADRVHHFVAQLATETGGLRLIAENMNYSAERLLQVFPKRVTPEQAKQLANKPVSIANHVYNGRLGNRFANDGWDYRGSGLIQLTGRGNIAGRGKELGLPSHTAITQTRLGEALYEKGHARGAEEHVQRGLGILQAQLGKDHPETAAAMCQLGSILLDRGELTQAFGLLRMAAAAHNTLEAFDYAGTRAPLVSHWPVYSDAAVQLLNMTFAELRRDPTLGRSEALRRAMVDLMDDPGQEDNPHPSIWAPFSLTGEGAQ